MPAEIVFSGGEKLRVEMDGSELVEKLGSPGTPQFLGNYLNVQVGGGKYVWVNYVWVNPVAVAFVRDG